MPKETDTIDWLSDNLDNYSPTDIPDILLYYTMDYALREDDFDFDYGIDFIDLPNNDHSKLSCNNGNKTNLFSSNSISHKSLQEYMTINSTSKKELIYMIKFLSLFDIFSLQKCKYIAHKLLSTFGSFRLALQAIEDPKTLQQRLGLDLAFSHLFRSMRIYSTAIAIHCITDASPAEAVSSILHEGSEQETKHQTTTHPNEKAFRWKGRQIDPEIVEVLLSIQKPSSRFEGPDSESPITKSIASYRDILIGVWWVYWSMKRLRDCFMSQAEMAHLWDVLTNRSQENMAWLDDIKNRCAKGYIPDEVIMAVIPKSPMSNRIAPVISLKDKVALMSLYASCFAELEKNDRKSCDFSYRLPSMNKLANASSLKYVPRAFWYSYLSNYLEYRKIISYHLSRGRYLFQTDIQSFVHTIEPKILYESMKMQGYEEEVSHAIYRFHVAWNEQDSRIGIPFGNSLTTCGMKIVLHRITMEMKVRGYSECNCFHYADDFVLVGETLDECRENLKTFDAVLAELNLERNLEKTTLRIPGETSQGVTIEAAIEDAYALAGFKPYFGRKMSKAEDMAFDPPESLTMGGENEPALEFNARLEIVPPSILSVLYQKHVKPHFDRGSMPDKSIMGYIIYRMIKCKMSESPGIVINAYIICPQYQIKILNWIRGAGDIEDIVVSELAEYYRNAKDKNYEWSDYSRSNFVQHICKMYQEGANFCSDKIIDLFTHWRHESGTGYLTRRELEYLFRIIELRVA